MLQRHAQVKLGRRGDRVNIQVDSVVQSVVAGQLGHLEADVLTDTSVVTSPAFAGVVPSPDIFPEY